MKEEKRPEETHKEKKCLASNIQAKRETKPAEITPEKKKKKGKTELICPPLRKKADKRMFRISGVQLTDHQEKPQAAFCGADASASLKLSLQSGGYVHG